MKKILAAILVLAACLEAGAQSKLFKLGQSVEVNTAILQELNRSYVDSLPVSKMTIAGINAMLETLDPYTIYVPEEENDPRLTDNSLRFHRHLGYREVGRFPGSGRKFGRWYNMVYMEKLIGGQGEKE